jgi:gliding motility-associated-like protein
MPVGNATWTPANDTVCEAAGPVTLTALNTGGVWSGTGITGNTFNPAGLGNTTVAITYIIGFGNCKDTVTNNVYVAPDVDPSWAFTSSAICTTSPIVSLNSLITGTSGGTWSGLGVTGNSFDPSALNGMIYVTYTVGQGMCSESFTDSIDVVIQPITFAGNDTVVCGLVDTLNATALIGGGTWVSFPSNITISNVNNPNSVVTSTIEGTFQLVWMETLGGTCTAYDTVNITFWNTPTADAGPDQSIDIITSTFAAVPPTYGTGTWISASTGPVIAQPNNPFSAVNSLVAGQNVFTWSVTNGTCPAVTDDMVITVNEVTIPAGISPNGDGLNDVWVIAGISTLENELTIFNRWGVEVYHVVNYQNDWGGTKTNGEELPNDTYFYILKVNGYEDFTGYIIIKR